MLSNELKRKVNNLWDKFWAGGISNPLTAIEQISYLLFMRRLDELPNATQIFKGKEDFRWRVFGKIEEEGLSKEEIQQRDEERLAHVRDKVFPFIREMNGEGHPLTKHMKNAVFIIPKPSLLKDAIKAIDEIYDVIKGHQDEGQIFQDTQGDLYEYLINSISRAGKNGQFRTPRHIIQMIVSMLDPQLGDKICDPAAGTSGFLLGSYLHILTQHTSPQYRQVNDDGFELGTKGDLIKNERDWEILRRQSFYGYDFDQSMVRIGLMNLLLHGIDEPHIDYKDTLSKQYNESAHYKVVFANPPFKGSIDKGDINTDLKTPTTKTELLFVERIFHMLETGGRAGVIVPDGVLFGSSAAHQYLRRLLLHNCQLEAIVSMPGGVFKPYAGVSTAALVFVKVTDKDTGKIKKPHTERVWFYDMQSDGYSLDNKRSPLGHHGDLQDIVERYRNRRSEPNDDRKAKHFFVPVQEIIENDYDLSINRYKEVEYAEVQYDKPEVIMERMEKLEGEISGYLKEIKSLIG